MAKSTLIPKRSRLPDDSEEPQARMGFGEHLEELRKRIIYSLLGSSVFIAFCLYHMYDIPALLLRPYMLALQAHGYPPYLGYAKPAELVITYLSIAFKAGLILASPWIIYQLWLFIAAGLYARERKLVYKYIGPSAFLFLAGVAFFYFLVLPLTLNFFIAFDDYTASAQPHATAIEKRFLGLNAAPGVDMAKLATGDAATMPAIPIVKSDPTTMPATGVGHLYFNAEEGELKFIGNGHIWILLVGKQGALFVNLPQFDEYLSFVTMTALIFGLAFEMPMAILILAQAGLVAPATFRKIRKYAYFGIAVLSAIAAPSPNPLTMVCLMVPMMALYEAGLIAATAAVRRQEQRAAAE